MVTRLFDNLSRRAILVFRAGALGDTVLALPMLRAIREAIGPNGSLDFVGTLPWARLMLGQSFASQVHSVDRRLFLPFFSDVRDDGALRSFLSDFDAVVAVTKAARVEPLLRELGVPAVVISPFPSDGSHVGEYLVASIRSIGVPSVDQIPAVELKPAARALAKKFLRSCSLQAGFVAIHPGSGSPRKNWPLPRFRQVFSRLTNEGRDVLWIGGEADANILRDLKPSEGEPVARELDICVLASLLSDAGAFLGNDSGVSHLAAAVGTPTIALYGPTNPRQWLPIGEFVRALPFSATSYEVGINILEALCQNDCEHSI